METLDKKKLAPPPEYITVYGKKIKIGAKPNEGNDLKTILWVTKELSKLDLFDEDELFDHPRT